MIIRFRPSPIVVLCIVTLIWAFSFSLIGVYLSGQVDSYLAVFIRVFLAFLVLLPFFKPHQLPGKQLLALTFIGAVQVGVTYQFLYHAFSYLSVAEVLLFTIFTPLWITLIDEVLLGKRHLPMRWWLGSALAVMGALIIRYQNISADAITGFCLIQAANLCFALGQVAYRRLPIADAKLQVQTFACFFLGATLVSGLGSVLFADWQKVPNNLTEWLVLIWLGLGASGFGYLAWAMASKRVNTGQLASMNNLLIPAGILVNILFWQQSADWPRLLIGGAVIALAVWVCRPQTA
ncbi:DMT family transporter [Gilvimarinus agarilyticus]|uniref:EamA family transporter n=1 Tax=Gilvimarinus sp. 2_MG-2023 TaxID=3062666 RepID=UPI001C09EC32|nr:EamA family transporter [Gilvimarinus sp. 2_MG-2023]MBU2886857.1 DMT family transporter [Gilvimarinus agarilyticus]MDO6571518.1 EamA family transporter [Gilvimarinus sp. 2_MG-2023]